MYSLTQHLFQRYYCNIRIYTPVQGIILDSACLSVSVTVCLSVSVDTILCIEVLFLDKVELFPSFNRCTSNMWIMGKDIFWPAFLCDLFPFVTSYWNVSLWIFMCWTIPFLVLLIWIIKTIQITMSWMAWILDQLTQPEQRQLQYQELFDPPPYGPLVFVL